MPNLVAINKSEFLNRTWQRPSNFLFTTNDAVCPISIQEATNALMSMPLAFVPNAGEFTLVAVQSLQPNSNSFVSEKGLWLNRYCPIRYKTYPFIMVPDQSESERLILCIDEDSSLLQNDSGVGEAFFETDGELSPLLKDLVDSLTKHYLNMAKTVRLCESLNKHKLLRPWELQLKFESGTRNVEGLYCVDEKALNELDDSVIAELHKSGAFTLIYCQLLSMQLVSELVKLDSEYKGQESSKTDFGFSLDSNVDDGNISFDSIK